LSSQDINDSAWEDQAWQRLDKWLWCARFLKARSACARLVAEGTVRINRQATEKPHARLRPGDVLTFAVAGRVRVVRVMSLGQRRGPAPEARLLYTELAEPPAGGTLPDAGGALSCAGDERSAYRPN
jgi:ribosome-associated heat shock protein Hsp15